MWTDVPNFATDDVVTADTFQTIWQNMEHLKDPMTAEHRVERSATPFTKSVTGSFGDFGGEFEITFTSSGNDLLICAFFPIKHSALNGIGYFTFALDGVTLGNTNGLGNSYDSADEESLNLLHIIEGVDAGEHTVELLWWNQTAGTLQIDRLETVIYISVMEF